MPGKVKFQDPEYATPENISFRPVSSSWAYRLRIILGILLLCTASWHLFKYQSSTISTYTFTISRLIRRPSTSLPSRPLEWSDVNFIHTTDTHGWLLGHDKDSQPEPNGSGNFGDFLSFVTHMKALAASQDVDLLLVDSGDLHDGNGLTDGFPSGGVNGHEANKLFSRLPYDVLAAGNHALYNYTVALDVHKEFAPVWNGRYLTSNINITIVEKDGTSTAVPIGEKYTKFTTPRGRRVTAFGVLFDFVNNAKGISVQTVERMLQENWFAEAIEEAPDFFLLIGHMAVVGSKWPEVVQKIRSHHPHIPIFIFGGHTHIRDCAIVDERAIALESGRYMETVGWLSASIPSDSTHTFNFSRRYLDANRISYQYHTHTTERNFDTMAGTRLTKDLKKLSREYGLDHVYGVAPQDFYLDRAPYPGPHSAVSLFVDKVVPSVLSDTNPQRRHEPRMIFINSGSLRFDIFKGPFTRNDQFIISPFGDAFLYLRAPYGISRQVLMKLNRYGAFSSSRDVEKRKTQSYLQAQGITDDPSRQRHHPALTLGYVTKDSCSSYPGDDVLHSPLPYYAPPDYVSHSDVPTGSSNETLTDIVFVRFFASDVVRALNELRVESRELDLPQGRNVTVEDIVTYTHVRSNEVFGLYAKKAWS